MTGRVEQITPDRWREQVADTVAAGWDYPEFLTAVDLPDDGLIEVVLGLRRVGGPLVSAGGYLPAVRLLSTRIDRGRPDIESVAAVIPGLGWYEREAHEMFGVNFAGNEDLAPLLLVQLGSWPGRRTSPLPARLTTRWPGLSDPADSPPAGQPPARRRAAGLIPGNNPAWLR